MDPRVIAALSLALLFFAQHRVRVLWSRVRQGLVILTQPWRHLREVALLQALGWGCRVAAAFFFLKAFEIEA